MTTAQHGVVLAFDFGLRRIGIASGNLLTRTASPVATVEVRRELPWTELDRLIADWQPDVIVVGRPGGTAESDVKAGIEDFVAELARRYAVPVETVDETLTSQAASSVLREGRRSGYLRRRVSRGHVDRHAACLIAEQWMCRP